eukprot:5521-Heterococcus_DN1.PRE.3
MNEDYWHAVRGYQVFAYEQFEALSITQQGELVTNSYHHIACAGSYTTNTTTLVDTTKQYTSWLTLCKLLVVLILTGLDRRALHYKEHASVNRSTSAHTAAAKAYTTLPCKVLYGNKQLMPYE